MKLLSAPRAKALVVAAAIAGGLGLAGSAQAAGGCGPGFHPNPWGRCRPNDRGYGYGGYGGPRRFYEGRPFGYADGYGRRGGYDYDRPRRFYDGY